MPFCGFNKQMLEGLLLFGAGLWMQAEKRAGEDGKSLEQSIANELDELEAFLKVLSQLPESPRTSAITGAAMVARFLYQNAVGNTSQEMRKRFFEGSERFAEFLRLMDDIYYDELLPGSTQEVALKRIGEWIQAH